MEHCVVIRPTTGRVADLQCDKCCIDLDVERLSLTYWLTDHHSTVHTAVIYSSNCVPEPGYKIRPLPGSKIQIRVGVWANFSKVAEPSLSEKYLDSAGKMWRAGAQKRQYL